MLKFIKESVKEFEHVVWPTNKETKKYFTIVTGLIAILTLFLFIVGTIFSNSLFGLGKILRSPKPVQQIENPANDIEFASGADLNLAPNSTGSSTPTK